jgi:MFS superfamily sulfate permease-like transporter/CRP-like cAMP-binding protein
MSTNDETECTLLMGLFSPPPEDDNENGGARTETETEPTKEAEPVSNSQDNKPPEHNGAELNGSRQDIVMDSTVEEADTDQNHFITQERQHEANSMRDEFRRSNTVKASGNTKTLMEMFHDSNQEPAPAHERLPLLHNRKDPYEESGFGDVSAPGAPAHERQSSLGGFLDHLFTSPTEPTPKTAGNSRKVYSAAPYTRARSMSEMPAIDESKLTVYEEEESPHKVRFKNFCATHMKATTFVGSCMFLLYHVVFCLAMGSSIIRKQSETPILGLMAKMAACGVIFCSPVYVYRLGNEIPALYPTVDLFLAPFMANLAVIVDSTLEADASVTGKDGDQVFIATLATLSGIGMICSGTLLVLGSKFRLANLGSYLPFPVLCGFFSAVGLLMWSLAFTVDTNGKKVHSVFTSGDMGLICNSLLHHLPSLIIAICMKWIGPLNPFLVSGIVVCTVVVFYVIMAITGTTLEEARKEEWFWSHHDLVYEDKQVHVGFDNWAPPAPFGVLNTLLEGKVHWAAVWEGMPTVCALSFLYMLRCSIHGTALKKNVANLARTARKDDPVTSPQCGRQLSPQQNRHRRLFSEALDIEAVTIGNTDKSSEKPIYRAKETNISLEKILLVYGHTQFVSAIVGSFGVTPSVAASPTMFSLGAEGVAPQYGSVVLLLVFYLTDFQLVGYIPKAAFSSLIVLAFLDMTATWFFKSYQKTSDKMEWLVVPVIIVAAFAIGLLNSVFLGIAASTVLFVASFLRSGTVKFMASGLTVRSTIERPFLSGDWLDQNGDQIQILVLQNYLFFGNASSILAYITTMFEEPEAEASFHDDDADYELTPMPKFVIVDFTLVTGMDTSAVDVIAGIIQVCKSHGCKLFLAGLSQRMRLTLSLGNVKPETGERSQRQIRFFPDLDSALGKAEDMLLRDSPIYQSDNNGGSRRRLLSEGDANRSGFGFALRHIDEQHGKEFAEGLQGLQKYTSPIELAPGESLFSCDGGIIQEHERGLFFIEEGIMKIERDSSVTLTRGSLTQNTLEPTRSSFDSEGSIGQMHARSKTMARRVETIKSAGHVNTTHFRLARIGPGWVLGSIEGASGNQNTGRHVAVSHCRLHHLPFSKIEAIEKDEALLVLRLYKLLAHLMARRQEITIEQLATLHSIMSSPAMKNPSRKSSRAI